MANANSPRGFVPSRKIGGQPHSGGVNRYYRGTGDANNLFIGDPVDVSGSGDAFGVPGVVRSTAGSAGYSIGVVVGVENNTSDNLTRSYLPSGVAGYVLVADDPDEEFEIQENGAIAVTAIGLNVDFSFSTAGNTTTGLSGCQIASAGADTTNTLQCRILGIVEKPDNEVGTNGKWRVRFNLHRNRFTTGS